ncbi:hypothetical protein B0H13DRAFT_2029492 [Mycena leptocephala]|nr:hypothetical protein B0H13DRAFT_2029492 [Mycena leptocephala]
MTWLYVCVVLVMSLCAAEVRAACAGAAQSQPLYRAWNPTISDHFYTPSLAEYNSAGDYTPEGIRARLFTTQVAGSVRLIRLEERVDGGGYVIEDKNPMYVYPTALCGSVPFYRLFAGAYGDHFYTESAEERDGSETSGWAYEWIAGYVFPPDADTSAGGGTTTTTTQKDTVTTTNTKTSTSTDTAKAPTSPTPPTTATTSTSAGPAAPSPPALGTADPVDPAPTSMLDGSSTTSGDSSSSTSLSGTSGTMRLRLHLTPASASYIVAAVALVMGGWL